MLLLSPKALDSYVPDISYLEIDRVQIYIPPVLSLARLMLRGGTL